QLAVTEIRLADLERDQQMFARGQAGDVLRDLDIARARLEIDHRAAVGRKHTVVTVEDMFELNLGGAADGRGRIAPAFDEPLGVDGAEAGSARVIAGPT